MQPRAGDAVKKPQPQAGAPDITLPRGPDGQRSKPDNPARSTVDFKGKDLASYRLADGSLDTAKLAGKLTSDVRQVLQKPETRPREVVLVLHDVRTKPEQPGKPSDAAQVGAVFREVLKREHTAGHAVARDEKGWRRDVPGSREARPADRTEAGTPAARSA